MFDIDRKKLKRPKRSVDEWIELENMRAKARAIINMPIPFFFLKKINNKAKNDMKIKDIQRRGRRRKR